MSLTIALLSFVAASAQAASGSPWFNDSADCRSHWTSSYDTCRIRRDADSREQQAIDTRLAQAQLACNAAAQAVDEASGAVAQIDARVADQRDIAIPLLERAMANASEARDLLKNSSLSAVSDARGLLQDRIGGAPSSATLSLAAAAGLAFGVTDPLAEGLIFDAALPRARSDGDGTKSTLETHNTDFDRIFDRIRIESPSSTASDSLSGIALTLAQAAVDDEAGLDNAKASQSTLESDASDAQSKSARAVKSLKEAETQLTALKDRKNALPELINGESDCMTNAADYRDNRCSLYWAHPPINAGGAP